MRKSTNLWVLLGVLGVLLLCSLGMRRWYVCSWRGECPIKQVREEKGVQLILYSAKRKYVYKRDSLDFRVTIRNASDSKVVLHPVDYRGYPEPAISIVVTHGGGFIKWQEQHFDLAYHEIPLAPGEELTFEIHIPPEEWKPSGIESTKVSVCAHIYVSILTKEPPKLLELGNSLIFSVSSP